mmetsp:Transcript_16322/g.19939  ORF Transcript_16322/g.19939 Transcript_16322/m.19939 type:complete len:252 (+) Transcript_16322:160-915(+)
MSFTKSCHFSIYWSLVLLIFVFQLTMTKGDVAYDKHFDFYVLSMSYQPQFCYLHRREGFVGCENPMDFWRGSLTLHGLWPERKDGSWPSTCSNEKFDPEVVEDIGSDKFHTYWPNVKASESSPSRFGFWEHEWTKHGTCSGLNQEEYFKKTLSHFLKTPSIIRERYGGSVTKTELIDAYGGDVVLICQSGRYLSEVRTCVGKQEDGTPTKHIDCIPEVEDDDNCDDVILITKFYSDKEENIDEYGQITMTK